MVAAEGGDFDDFRPEHHVRQAETTAHQTTVAEQFTHLIRRRAGCHVKIFRFFTKQEVTYATADEIGFIARLVQSIEHLEGIITDIFAGNCMLFTRDNRHMRLFNGGFCVALFTA